MKDYIDKLTAKTAKAEHLREQAKAKSRVVDMRVSPEWVPLAEQIEALMRNLPSAQRERPWAMEELCLRLKGKFDSHPHPMHIGKALRSLGWIQMCDWTNAGGGRRVWAQPE